MQKLSVALNELQGVIDIFIDREALGCPQDPKI